MQVARYQKSEQYLRKSCKHDISLTVLIQWIRVVLSTTIAATAISTLAPQIFAMTNAASAATELFEIFDQQSQLDPLENTGKKSDNCRGEIEVKALDFAYPSRPTAQVLKGLNLSIPAGKTTALVGASGSGKSTLIGLLERWYLPSSGSITLDGLDIADYNIKWLRSQIRLVQQVLFELLVIHKLTTCLGTCFVPWNSI